MKNYVQFEDGSLGNSQDVSTIPLTVSYRDAHPKDRYVEVEKFLTHQVRESGLNRVTSLVSLFGTGKTYSMYYLAQSRNSKYVVPVQLSLQYFQRMIENKDQYGNNIGLVIALENEFRRALSWYCVCAEMLIKDQNLSPIEFLRFMMNGGKKIFSDIVSAIQETKLECIPNGHNMIFVFDDVEQDLIKVARNLNILKKVSDGGGSMFDIAYRASQPIAPSLFMGTSYEMQYIESHVDDLANDLNECYINLMPVYAHNVVAFVQQLISAEENEILPLRFFLQGRPKHFDIFINTLHQICLSNNCTKEEFDQMSKEDQRGLRKQILEQTLVQVNQKIYNMYQPFVNLLLAYDPNLSLRIAIFGFIEASKNLTKQDMELLSKAGVAHFSLSKTISRILEPQFMKVFIDEHLHKGLEQEQKFLDALEYHAATNPHRISKTFLAYILMNISRTHWNQPITNHPLFKEFKGTYLDNFKLVVRYYHYDQDALSIAKDSKSAFKIHSLDNMGLTPSMIHALAEDTTVSSFEKDVMQRFELPSIVLFTPEYASPTVVAMLVPLSGVGRCIPLTSTVVQSMFEIKEDYKHTNIFYFLDTRVENENIRRDLAKIDPAKALRILVTPRMKMFNTSLRSLVFPEYHQERSNEEYTIVNSEGHCVTLWSVENPIFMDYLRSHPRSASLIKIFNRCSEAFELYV
jgi:hypothetical protein